MQFNRKGRRVRRQSSSKQPSFSYYSGRQSGNGEPVKARGAKRPRHFKQTLLHLPVYLAAIAIVICIGYTLTLSTLPRVIVFNQSKLLKLREATEYDQAAQALLKSSVVNLTKITINTNKLEAELKKRFPELSVAAVTIPIMGRRPVIKLEVALPVLIFRSSGEDYILSGEGKALLAADDASLKELPVISDQSRLEVNIGDTVLTRDEVSFIYEIVAQFRAKNLNITALTLPQLPSELQVKIKGAPYFVKFDLLSDSKTQIGSFLAVKQRLKTKHITPKQYVDVRVEGKAYYK